MGPILFDAAAAALAVRRARGNAVNLAALAAALADVLAARVVTAAGGFLLRRKATITVTGRRVIIDDRTGRTLAATRPDFNDPGEPFKP